MSAPVRENPLSAVSGPDTSRAGRGPLGALPALSVAARRALVLTGVLAVLDAAALVAQAFLLASVLAAVVAGDGTGHGAELVALLGAVLGRAGTAWAKRVVAARAAAGAKEELRAKVVDKALRLGPEWIDRTGAGKLTALTTRGLDALDAYFTEYLPALVTAAVVPVAVGAAVLVADWPSALLIVATLPLLPLFAILIGKYTADRVGAATDAVHRLSGNLLELVRALPVLAAFRRAEAQASVVRRVSDRHRRTTVSTLRLAFASAFALELAATLSVALVAVAIGVRLVSGDLGLAVGLGVLLLAPECYQPLRSVGAAFHASEDGVEAVRRVAAVLDEPEPRPGARVPGRGAVHIRNLRVARRDGYAPDGLTSTVRPGRTTWLDAPSGAGKTTTLAVLLGFATPASGTVTIDGVPIEDIDMSTWRDDVAWVPQSPAFAGGTVRAELALAVPGRATTGDDPDTPEVAPDVGADIGAVLAAVGLDGVADRPVRELSAGQRQRLAVARALLRVRRGAWLLLLDEPTAHLDPANAERVWTAVRAAERAGAAVLVAAHTRDGIARHPGTPGTDGTGIAETVPLPDGSTSAGRDTVDGHGTVGDSATVGSDDTVDTDRQHAGEPARPRPVPLRWLTERGIVRGVLLGAGALLSGVALTATSGWLIARAAQQPPILTLTTLVVGVRTFGLARAGLRYLERLVTHDAAFRVATRLRERLWRALVRLGPARTAALHRGEGLRRLVDDVDTIRDLLPRTVTPPLVAALVALGAVVVQTAFLPSAGAVLLAAVVLGGLAAPALALATERRATATLAAGRRDVAERVLGLFDAAAELIAVGAHRRQRDGLARADRRLAALARRQAFGAGSADAVIVVATGAATVAATWLAARAVEAGTLTPVAAPLLALVPLALAETLASVPPAAQHRDSLRAARVRLAATLDEASGVPEGPSRAEAGGTVRTGTGGHVALHGVDVAWPGGPDGSGAGATPVLRDVDLEIPAGSFVAVLGPSGAGKSTLMAAVLGFLPPQRGHATLPARVAWAPQDPQLVSTTVAENLRLADPHATDTDLRRALHTACLGDLEPGTMLGDAGTGLSGGQAQRVAVARALLAVPDSDVVLLDEPTAHLDERTAHHLMTALRTELAGRTVLHVTHSRAEAADADLVVEVADGAVRVVDDSGSPARPPDVAPTRTHATSTATGRA